MSTAVGDYAKNVFINCPFDEQYAVLLRPLIFTLQTLGFQARIANERFNSLEPRLDRIREFIVSSKYGIHDLSRIQAEKSGDFCRMNMPFELGLDMGCRFFSPAPEHAEKVLLILEKERHQVRRVASDLAAFEIQPHGNDPKLIVRRVRNWFVDNGLSEAPTVTALWYRYTDFMTDLQKKTENLEEDDLNEMPIKEFVAHIAEWSGAD